MFINRELFVLILLLIINIIFIGSIKECKKTKNDFELMYPCECVSEIDIIYVEGELKDSLMICSIEEKELLYDAIMGMEFKRPFSLGSLPNIASGYAIKIIYDNKDVEYIGYTAIKRYKSDQLITGSFCCDKEEFYDLINKFCKIS